MTEGKASKMDHEEYKKTQQTSCDQCARKDSCEWLEKTGEKLNLCHKFVSGELTYFEPSNKEDYHAKQDYGKAKLSLVPRRIIWDVAAIREYGNDKYPDGGPDNWREVAAERYRDAAYRHFLRYLDDPKSIDTESGFPHLWHLACNIAFLCEIEDQYLSKNPEVVRKLKVIFDGTVNEWKEEKNVGILRDMAYDAIELG